MITRHHDHTDDPGLQHDLEELVRQRRRMLGWMLSGGMLLLAGCGGGGDSSSSGTASGSTDSSGTTTGGTGTGTTGTAGCTALPQETAGPYPSDGSNAIGGVTSNVLVQSGILRSDIRSSFGVASGTAPGIPVRLTLKLLDANHGCMPLSGYTVYLWHCTRDGNYSLYSSAVVNENFLRGVQIADANGEVTFTTIFPGCYSGRYPHIHFEIYPDLGLTTSHTNRVLTSQIALSRDVCSAVYNGAAGYEASARNLTGVTVTTDNVFGDNTAAQIAAMELPLTGSLTEGYSGSMVIGVPAA